MIGRMMALCAAAAIVIACTDASGQRYRWDHEFGQEGPSGRVYAIAEYDGDLFIGGDFSLPVGMGEEYNVGMWDGSAWSVPGGGLGGTSDVVHALIEYGGLLFAGGEFPDYVATWNGIAWSDGSNGLPSGTYDVTDFAIVGNDLLASVAWNAPPDTFTAVFRKTSASAAWQQLGHAWESNWINAIGTDGTYGELAVVGPFYDVVPGLPGRTMQFSSGLGDFVQMPDSTVCGNLAGMNANPLDTEFFDGQFYAGGGEYADQCIEHHLTFGRFDSGDWEDLLADALVFSLLGYDEGSGDNLIVGGGFANIGDDPLLSTPPDFLNRIGRFDGTDWSVLCTGVSDGVVDALGEWQGSLIVGGEFGTAGGMDVENVARWFFDPCIKDWDGSGGFDFFDHTAYQDDYAAGNMRADLDCDGELTNADYQAFSALSTAGCS